MQNPKNHLSGCRDFYTDFGANKCCRGDSGAKCHSRHQPSHTLNDKIQKLELNPELQIKIYSHHRYTQSLMRQIHSSVIWRTHNTMLYDDNLLRLCWWQFLGIATENGQIVSIFSNDMVNLRNVTIIWNQLILKSNEKVYRKKGEIEQKKTATDCAQFYVEHFTMCTIQFKLFLNSLTVLRSTNETHSISATRWIARRMATSHAKQNAVNLIITVESK